MGEEWSVRGEGEVSVSEGVVRLLLVWAKKGARGVWRVFFLRVLVLTDGAVRDAGGGGDA